MLNELKRSLHTSDPIKAQVRSLLYIKLLANLKSTLMATIISTQSDAREAARKHFLEKLHAFDERIRRYGVYGDVEHQGGIFEGATEDSLEALDYMRTDDAERHEKEASTLSAKIVNGRYSSNDNEELNDFIANGSFEVGKELFADLRYEYFLAKSEYLEALAWGHSDRREEYERRLARYTRKLSKPVDISPPLSEAERAPIVKDLIPLFLESKKGKSANTFKDYKTKLYFWVELAGEKVKFTKDSAVELKELLLRLPSNYKKYLTDEITTAKQLAESGRFPIDKRLSDNYINQVINVLSMFSAWAISHAKISLSDNPFNGLKIKGAKTKHKLAPFDGEDLKTIFSSKQWTKNKHSPKHYWIALISLFTGARLSEVAQLDVIDIKHNNEIYYFNFTDEGEGKSLKTSSSKRKVPIHPFLIKKGFLLYVESQRELNEQKLFSDIDKQGESNYGDGVSSWFSGYKKTLGLPTGSKTFHSFRRTFITYAINELKISVHNVKELVGHIDNDVTTGIYRQSSSLEDLTEILFKFKLEDKLPDFPIFNRR